MPKSRRPQFIELDRKFREVDRDTKPEDHAYESYTREFSSSSAIGWTDLLSSSLVVILGEPGSGKTWEFQERVRVLSNEGRYAFFLPLDRLVRDDVRSILSIEDQGRFDRWKNGDQIAFFFLDSVDEAKFRSNSDFYQALGRLSSDLAGDLRSRASIVVSSRLSEWTPTEDEYQFKELFRLPPIPANRETALSTISEDGEVAIFEEEVDDPSADIEVKIFEFEPLDRRQVELLTSAQGVLNISAFFDTLDTASAWEFTRRPLDVKSLVNYWQQHGKIGSLTEIILWDIKTKLLPHTSRVEFSLADGQARIGAQNMASATVFCKAFAFAVNDDELQLVNTLTPRECLPDDWQDEQIRALHNRPIFDGAAYGRFRFHHRRISEFLAAEWISSRMDSGCSRRVLEDLLAATVRGRKVLRQSLRPIIAWLCIGDAPWRDRVRELVLAADPSIHLAFGDPASLPVEYRRQVLLRIAHESRNRKRKRTDSSQDALGRIADASLSDTIAVLIADDSLAIDFRIELLDIVRHGKLDACIQAALNLVAGDNSGTPLLYHATNTILEMGDPGSTALLYHSLSKREEISDLVCSLVVCKLFPNKISSDQVCAILRKARKERNRYWHLPDTLHEFITQSLDPDKAAELLVGFVEMVRSGENMMHGDEETPVSNEFYWVRKLLPPSIEVTLRNSSLSVDTIATVLDALLLLRKVVRYFDSDEIQRINKSTLGHPQIRQRYIWSVVEEFRKRDSNIDPSLFEVFDHEGIVKASHADLLWLHKDSGHKSDDRDRKLAAKFCVELEKYVPLSQIEDDNFAEYHREPTPDPLFWRHRRFAAIGLVLAAQGIRLNSADLRLRRESIGISVRCQNRITFLKHLSDLKSGRETGWLWRFRNEAMSRGDNHWAPTSWTKVKRFWGPVICNAAMEGCVSLWRGHNALLPHEKPEKDRVSVLTILGLVGLEVELVGNAMSIAKLTSSEALNATRYAMNEMNGFSNWLDDLASVFPIEVQTILNECVEDEWKFEASRVDTHELLADLAEVDNDLTHLVAPKLLYLISNGDPPHSSILEYGLSILMRSADPPLEKLENVASLRAIEGQSHSVIARWLAIWMHINAGLAIDRLEVLIRKAPNAAEIVLSLCNLLFNRDRERHPYGDNPSYLVSKNLARLIPIVYNHVRTDEDQEYNDGQKNPRRHYAQRFRDALIPFLDNDADPSVTDYLVDVEQLVGPGVARDWVLDLLKIRVTREADFTPWRVEEIRDFVRTHEVDPKNQSELFAIACRRIDDLKMGVEESESSTRDQLRKGDEEIMFRKWLHLKLSDQARGRYTVVQEDELDQKWRPDLRTQHPQGGTVSIEVKWADNWSVRDLIKGLEAQLVGKYLRDHRWRYGIYVLGNIGNKVYWQHPDSRKRMNFQDVLSLLTSRADNFVAENAGLDGLSVVGMDFRPLVDRQ